ncbi:MAG: hypothetical protein KKB70_09555 [Proteobacteria bacterium]|nr:hypothetical protein [Pseudomonadota bacterium]MBU1610733.1 hypothetical protein [Pseudomonadota bacterium]
MIVTLIQLGFLSLLLVTSNVLLKLHFNAHPLTESLNLAVVPTTILCLLSSGYAWGALISITSAICLWVVMINQHPLSVIYPMVSLSYVLMIFADWAVFGHSITLTKLIGAGLVCLGILILSR